MPDRTKRLFLVLWALGIAGVLSFLLVDLGAMIAMVPVPEDQKAEMPPWFAIVACWLLFRPFLDAEFVVRSEAFNKLIPAAVRFLYGGLTEEVLLRWGMMTFLAFLFWQLFGRRAERPGRLAFVAAITISALLFGVGHLPIASLLAGGLNVPLTLFVITANSIFGIVAGFLYWRLGLESAMIAHIFAHVVLLSGVYLAL